MFYYTITMTGTYFVTANGANEAVTKVYEALLGNPIYAGILGSGEVNPDNAIIQSGTHFTIQHGDDNAN